MTTLDSPEPFDAIVIGAGQAGVPLATDLASAGRRTALVEREHVGGTCVNVGCSPTKTMVASARVAHLARRAAEYGVRAGRVRVDQAKVRERKRAIVESFRGGLEESLRAVPNLALVEGEARFMGPRTVAVREPSGPERVLSAPLVVVNTGCRPARPDLPGLDSVAALDSTSVMELREVPRHLLVLGGGPIGLEFGQMFRRFGSRVTIVQRGTRLLPRVDRDVAEEVARILAGDGIEVLLETEAIGAAPTGAGLVLRVGHGGGTRTLRGTHLLLAAGRVPNTEALDLPVGGIATDDRGFVRVDERLSTSAPGVFAAGDVKGGPAFTHVSYDDYRVLRENLLRGGSATTRGRLVPWTVFTDPEIAHVGLSESEAKVRGLEVRVAKLPMGEVARALETDEARGFLKALVEPGSGRILGFTAIAVGGGELMAAVEVAMLADLPASRLREAIFVHPTMAEALNNLFAVAEGP